MPEGSTRGRYPVADHVLPRCGARFECGAGEHVRERERERGREDWAVIYNVRAGTASKQVLRPWATDSSNQARVASCAGNCRS